jgi:hypothetical protein
MSDDWEGHIARGNSRGGIDYAVGTGTPITAPIDGRLENRPNNGNGFGNYIRLHHGDGWIDEFLHLRDGGFVPEGYYSQGQVIGYSGNTGNSTGPHVHWHLIAPNGTRVNPLDAVNVHANNAAAETAAANAAAALAASRKKAEKGMYYNKVATNGWHYVVGQEYIRVITGAEVPHVTHNMGEPRVHGQLEHFIFWCQSLGIPESVVRGLSATNRNWSRLGTLTSGGGAPASAVDVDAIAKAVDASLKDDFAAIPKTVNDDAAKRLSS